ncbi:hypothetical protein SALBM135S_04758 [Streptomyces alboniger]
MAPYCVSGGWLQPVRAAPSVPKRKVAGRPRNGRHRFRPLPGTATDVTPDTGPVVGISAAYRALATTPPLYPTGPPPRAEPAERWPAPSPPPPVESPYVAPPPTYDTVPQPVYDPYDPAYDSGFATEPLPGPFQAPSSGEPWNAATGGHP